MKSTKNLYNFYSENPAEFVSKHTPEEVKKLRNFLADMKEDVTELDECIQIQDKVSQMSLEELLSFF